MTWIEGVDYSVSRPSPSGLYTAGKRFAMRYVGLGTSDKHLTWSERAALHSAGLGIGVVCEGTEAWMLRGRDAGIEAAVISNRHVVKCGLPPWTPIFFAADFQGNIYQWNAVLNCLRGAESVIGYDRTGLYGGYECVRYVVQEMGARYYWQTHAWSHGMWHPSAHIQQYHNGVTVAGGDCDLVRTSFVTSGIVFPTGFPVNYPSWTERLIVNLPTLSRGSTGTPVKRAQALANVFGADLAEDGHFGPITESKVRHFQSTHNCGVDGIVGPQTWTALLTA